MSYWAMDEEEHLQLRGSGFESWHLILDGMKRNGVS